MGIQIRTYKEISGTVDFPKEELAFSRLLEIVKILRSPEGCPWDREQTPHTLTGALIEETYELIEAIRNEDQENIKEELGDLALLFSMIAYMKFQDGHFSIDMVLDSVCEKLVRRHPHVFSESNAKTTNEVLIQWDEIKAKEKMADSNHKSLLNKVGRFLPPLERSYEIQKKVAKVGFDWSTVSQVIDKIREELLEVEEEILQSQDKAKLELELGDLLFSVVNLTRYLDVHPSIALNRTIEKFVRRFAFVEDKIKSNGLSISSETKEEMNKYWDLSKREVDG